MTKKKTVKDKQNNILREYLTIEDVKKIYPEGGYIVSCEVVLKDMISGPIGIEFDDGKKPFKAYPIGTFGGKEYYTKGYIPYGEGRYVAIKKKRIPRWILAMLILLLMIIAVSVGIYMFSGNNIDPNAAAYNPAFKRPASVSDEEILIPGYGKLETKVGSDELIGTVLFNPPGNPCYFKFSIIEEETGDVLYESKLVPPGQGISDVVINKTYDKVGSHKVTIKFDTFDIDDEDSKLNGSEIETELNVIN